MHGCEFSTVATDALVSKHQAISTHSADQKNIHCIGPVLDKIFYMLYTVCISYSEQH